MGGERNSMDPIRFYNCESARRILHICSIDHQNMIGMEIPQGTRKTFRYSFSVKYGHTRQPQFSYFSCGNHTEPIPGQKLISNSYNRDMAGSS